ncbi:lysozyme inhibitor LprI family protein [Acuticoccus kandeliae]|uniref:lysozyme inhibitor LprI family protein n=1 Tax=Acuticoccus kandeliae TaxID=2073160 RepID=UPI000D3E6D7E|nr:lysozyme inhibitor LprI family protein [Acuticoccus kandeliae]
MKPCLAGVLVAAALAGPAMAQSFDCAAAATADEKAICQSGALSALDDEMAALFQDIESHAMMGVSGETRDSQRAFLTERAACGANDACLTKLYHARIAELTATKKAVGQGAAQ